MLIDIGALEEDGAVVGPGAVLIFMERAGPYSPLRGAHDDILGPTGGEEVRVAEIIGESAGPSVDNRVGTVFLPLYECLVDRRRLCDDRPGIVDRRVEDARFSGRELVVGEDTARPASLDVVRLGGRHCDGFLAPLEEVVGRDVSPV